MTEDHVLVLAPKSFASKISKREGKIGVLNNDVSFDVDAGMNLMTSSGSCQATGADAMSRFANCLTYYSEQGL